MGAMGCSGGVAGVVEGRDEKTGVTTAVLGEDLGEIE